MWALEVGCGVSSVPFDRQLLSQRLVHSPSWDAALALCAELRLAVKTIRPDELSKKGRDSIVVCFLGEASTDGVADVAASPEGPTVALVLQARDDKVLVLRQGDTAPNVMPLSDLLERASGPAIQLSRIWLKDEQRPVEFGYGWLLQELKKHTSARREVVVSSVVIQAIALVTPLMTQTVIDKVITNHAISTLIALSVGLFVMTLFSAALSWVRQYLVLHTGNRVDAVLGSSVFSHLTRLPISYFEARPTGTLVTRLHGVETIRDFVTGAFVTAVLDVPFMLVFAVLMVYYSPLLSAITIAITLVMATISYFVAPRLRGLSNEQFMAGARVQAFSTEYISGMETVKSLQMEGRLEAQYSQLMADYMLNGFKARQAANTYNSAMTTLDQLSSMLVLAVGAWAAMQESSFTIGMLIAFQMMAGKVTQPLLRLSGLWQQFQQANIALRRLGDIMEVPVERFSLQPSSARDQAPSLSVQELGFSYSPESRPVYENLTFSIEAGQCVAIVGPSGCGKSTIAKLLQGFYPAYKGQILVGGRELRTVAVNELRSWFGVVPQETTLFSGTIADNLHAAAPRATLAQLSNACKLAGVHDAIEALPRGYLTELGERGVGLSGGQKQRLAIARALLRGAKILIFDESTANLDSASAEAIAQTINHLKGKLTIVFVAHHMPRGLNVDRVIKLPEGCDLPVKPMPPGTRASSPAAVNPVPVVRASYKPAGA
ncbi:hypothetical protein WJ87_05895 [Burkholderia ubonensis]|nr:hypothetical protein WJ87_05895 [Burkholderia ubonensis]